MGVYKGHGKVECRITSEEHRDLFAIPRAYYTSISKLLYFDCLTRCMEFSDDQSRVSL